MSGDDYRLPDAGEAQRRLALGWLALGIAALLGAGLFSVLLVLSRTPYVQDIFPWVDFFHTALVVHVDLSVLVWFLAFAGALWSLNATARFALLGRAALALAVAGAAVMAAAPFAGAGRPLMSNYIPVLQDRLFLAGLLVFAAGVFLLVWRAMTAIPRVGERMSGAAALRFGLNTTAVATAMAIMALVWSYLTIPAFVAGRAYYELLFWGVGHMLQFTYTLLMLVAWLWLVSASGVRLALSPRVVLVLFGLGLATVFMAPLIYYSFPVTSVEHIQLFTWLMQYGGSLATLPLGLAILHGLARSTAPEPGQAPLRAALLASMILFGVGGVIGFLIAGTNVTVPAHYHGSIVGVTLALMGLSYELLPRLGLGRPPRRPAVWQPWLYGAGQLLHVLGLLWSGGYNVQRKVAGAAQGLQGIEQIAAMGLMGLGGLVSVAGGFLYLYLVWCAWRDRPLSRRKRARNAG